MAGWGDNSQFADTWTFGRPDRQPAVRQPGASLVRPESPFRPGPAPPVAPTLADGNGLGAGFRQPGQSMAPPTGEAIPQAEGGGVIGGNLMAGQAQDAAPAPGANLVPPPEVIRGNTQGPGDVHPSWQLYHNSGRGEDYPAAVAAFRRSQGEGALKTQEGEANRGAELEKARILGASQIEAAGAANKIPGQTEYWQQKTQGEKAEQDKVARAKIGADYDTLMHEHPDSTFDTGTGQTKFKAKNESQYRDYLASKNLAIAQGNPKAGRQHYDESQLVRQWLDTQTLQPGANKDAMLDAARQNPEHWQGLVADAKKVMGVTHPAVQSDWGKIAEHITPEWMKPKQGVNY